MNRKEAIQKAKQILKNKGLFVHGVTWDFKIQWLRSLGDKKIKFDYEASKEVQELVKKFKLTKQEIQ